MCNTNPHPPRLKGLFPWGDFLVRCVLPSMIRISEAREPLSGGSAGRMRGGPRQRRTPAAAGRQRGGPDSSRSPQLRGEAVPGSPRAAADGPGSPAPRGVRGRARAC